MEPEQSTNEIFFLFCKALAFSLFPANCPDARGFFGLFLYLFCSRLIHKCLLKRNVNPIIMPDHRARDNIEELSWKSRQLYKKAYYILIIIEKSSPHSGGASSCHLHIAYSQVLEWAFQTSEIDSPFQIRKHFTRISSDQILKNSY